VLMFQLLRAKAWAKLEPERAPGSDQFLLNS
jgi:hypothetical protein